jgi:hypothetical protein
MKTTFARQGNGYVATVDWGRPVMCLIQKFVEEKTAKCLNTNAVKTVQTMDIGHAQNAKLSMPHYLRHTTTYVGVVENIGALNVALP